MNEKDVLVGCTTDREFHPAPKVNIQTLSVKGGNYFIDQRMGFLLIRFYHFPGWHLNIKSSPIPFNTGKAGKCG
jgi:hypothetical protein